METVAIILAAGVSSRMKTALPKVMHEVCGKPMLEYVLNACRKAGTKKIYVVVGYGAEKVKKQFADCKDVVWVNQTEQRGTAHAVLCCKKHLKDFSGQTLVLCGDGPMIKTQTLKTLIKTHKKERAAATLATAILDQPAGYGRLARDVKGNIAAIVEHNDCSNEQLKIKEVNPSYYLFDNKVMFEALRKVEPNNAKKEYYITDAIGIILSAGKKVAAVTAVEPQEMISANSREQLSEVNKAMQQRIQSELMQSGVTITNPENVWIQAGAKIAADTIIEPFTYISSDVKVGKNCRIGPFVCLERGVVLKNGEAV